MSRKKSGRENFTRWRKLIYLFSWLLGMLPYAIRSFMFEIISGCPGKIGAAIRYVILRTLVNSCGDNVYIARWCVFKNAKNISLGNNISFHEFAYVDGFGNITIGNDVSFAHSVSIISFEHNYEICDIPFKYQTIRPECITISSNVWVGCGVRILAGSMISSDVVIAANAVAKRDLSAGVYAGNPAIKVKEIR